MGLGEGHKVVEGRERGVGGGGRDRRVRGRGGTEGLEVGEGQRGWGEGHVQMGGGGGGGNIYRYRRYACTAVHFVDVNGIFEKRIIRTFGKCTRQLSR